MSHRGLGTQEWLSLEKGGFGASPVLRSPQTSCPPPLISPHSVPAFCSLLARFGAGFSLVLSSWSVPLGQPPCSTPCHKPATWMRGDRESLLWGGLAALATHPRERGCEGSPPCPHAPGTETCSQKPMPSRPGSCLQLCTAFAIPLQPVKTSQPPLPFIRGLLAFPAWILHGWI